MILGVDIGGTKTQLATFKEDGTIDQTVRFATSHDYEAFLRNLKEEAQVFRINQNDTCCAAVPGFIDRQSGVGHTFGNLPWRDESIAKDISDAVGVNSTTIENDSKLAGLAEARQLGSEYERVFYLTLSTGIGGALVVNDYLAHDIADMEIGKMPLTFEGKTDAWEEFASGRAFVQKHNAPASAVKSMETWGDYTKYLGPGVAIACSILQTDAIIFGGGLGQHADNFIDLLKPYIDELHPNVKKPKYLGAAYYGEESVVYGCYQHAKDSLQA